MVELERYNWAGLIVTARERKHDLLFPLPFHDRSSKLRTYTTFRCRGSDTSSCVCGRPGIYTMILYTTLLVCGRPGIYTMIFFLYDVSF